MDELFLNWFCSFVSCCNDLRIQIEKLIFYRLIRLNCPKAAMRSLRLARDNASSDHERLVYEGWILYDTGHREEALQKAEESIAHQRSFEAFFLKAYALADTSLDPSSSAKVVELLEEALKCPSDGLRKGQVLTLDTCPEVPTYRLFLRICSLIY